MMKVDSAVQKRMDRYLGEIHDQLQAGPGENRREILSNIAAHLHEALAQRVTGEATVSDVEAVLSEMDPPESYGVAPGVEAPASKTRTLGRLALASLGVAVIVPLALGLLIPRVDIIAFYLILGAPFLAASLVLGVLSWRQPTGKVAVIGSLVVLAVGLFVFPLRSESSKGADPVSIEGLASPERR